jgi:hypothetical protein
MTARISAGDCEVCGRVVDDPAVDLVRITGAAADPVICGKCMADVVLQWLRDKTEPRRPKPVLAVPGRVHEALGGDLAIYGLKVLYADGSRREFTWRALEDAWLCPTCRGSGSVERVLYEAEEGPGMDPCDDCGRTGLRPGILPGS